MNVQERYAMNSHVEHAMSVKAVLSLGAKVLALTILQLVCFVIASGLTLAPLMSDPAAAAGAQAAAAGLPLVMLLNTAVLAYPILRSRWHGWRLTAAMLFVFYGTYMLLPYVEVIAFPPVVAHMPPGMLPASFLMGAILALLFTPPAVFVLGKWKEGPAADAPSDRLAMPAREWAWKLAAIATAYLVLYFTFGYFVAWRTPAVAAYYGGSDPGSFWAQMGNVMRDTPWLPFFQVFRAMLWTLFALPVIRMMKGPRWEAGLAVALLFAVLMNSGLLLPSPIMPEGVRVAHLLETAPSNFIFGWVVAWLLTQPAQPARVLSVASGAH
jgi:hypothetical protein